LILVHVVGGILEAAVEVETSVLEIKAVVEVETSVLEINAAVEVKVKAAIEVKTAIKVKAATKVKTATTQLDNLITVTLDNDTQDNNKQ
jgi:hypothetical protein